jgi:hypothetical protein
MTFKNLHNNKIYGSLNRNCYKKEIFVLIIDTVSFVFVLIKILIIKLLPGLCRIKYVKSVGGKFNIKLITKSFHIVAGLFGNKAS